MKSRTIAADRDRDYSRDVRIALVLSLAGVIATFLFMKQPEVQPYQLRRPIELIPVVLPKELVQLPKPVERPARVAIPVPALNGEPAQNTVGKTTGADIFVPPTEFVLDSVKFVHVEHKPVALKLAQPDYPEMARAAGITGAVAVSMLVDTAGKVAEAQVYSSSGSNMLDGAALSAARECLFRPAYQRDRPVPVWVTMTYSFRLE